MSRKAPASLQPSVSRMQQRVRAVAALPPAEQGQACYCDGRAKRDFCAAVSAGEEAAVLLALDAVAAELWLGPHDAGRYGRAFRAALRRACMAGAMTAAQKRVLYSIEMRNLRRLTLRARHTPPGYEQQRAARRLPGQQRVMRLCFGELPELKMDMDDWPEVEPPVELLQKAVHRGWFSAATAEKMAEKSYDLLMDLFHPPAQALPPEDELETAPDVPGDTLCYFFCCKGWKQVRWVVAPWGELRHSCGLALAADGSFFVNQGEWGEPRGAVLKCR